MEQFKCIGGNSCEIEIDELLRRLGVQFATGLAEDDGLDEEITLLDVSKGSRGISPAERVNNFASPLSMSSRGKTTISAVR